MIFDLRFVARLRHSERVPADRNAGNQIFNHEMHRMHEIREWIEAFERVLTSAELLEERRVFSSRWMVRLSAESRYGILLTVGCDTGGCCRFATGSFATDEAAVTFKKTLGGN